MRAYYFIIVIVTIESDTDYSMSDSSHLFVVVRACVRISRYKLYTLVHVCVCLAQVVELQSKPSNFNVTPHIRVVCDSQNLHPVDMRCGICIVLR